MPSKKRKSSILDKPADSKKGKKNEDQEEDSAVAETDDVLEGDSSQVGASNEVTPSKTSIQVLKRDWENLNRRKPDPVSDREFERSLARIATKGVVQLFNAIREHQSRVDEAVNQRNGTMTKVERAVKSVSKKDTFLDLVSKTKRKIEKKSEAKEETIRKKSDFKGKVIKKEEIEDVDETVSNKWDVLRDDFLLQSAKDWDKDD